MVQAVILAAGESSRLKPLTENKQKALLPIANKPIIYYHLKTLKKLKIDDILVVVGYKKEKTLEFLKDYNLKIVEQEKYLGTANALYCAKNFIKDDFLLIYGDVFFEDDLKGLLKKRRNTVCIYKVKDVSRYAKIELKNGKVIKIAEKSETGEGYINAGIYLLSNEIFDKIEETKLSERGEYELTDSLKMLNNLFAYKLKGYWFDIGYPWDYLEANMLMLKKIKFSIGKNTEIWKNATIKKPVIIGENCEIKNCVLDNCIIGNNCVIGEFSVVKRSVVMNNSKVPHLNYVADSIIGENCNLGAGTKIANLKFNEKNVEINIKGKKVDSGKRKFGVIMGDNVKTGINVSIYPGVKIGSNCWIGAEVLVREDLESNTYVKVKQELEIKKLL